MEYKTLGRIGLLVSHLCFGTLTIGPLQKNFSVDKGAALLVEALDKGITFFDTAQTYQTYPYLREMLKKTQKEVIIASKSYAFTANDMQNSLEEARKALDRDYIDIFLLHEQESALTLKGHADAWDVLVTAKAAGLVKAIGVSTHHVQCVDAAAALPELDVIHPMLNKEGIGIVDGTAEDMLAAIRRARAKGIGIYAMKPLGGGNLSKRYQQALRYMYDLQELDSIAIGMQDSSELEANIRLQERKEISTALDAKLLQAEKNLYIKDWCTGCGQCIERCSQDALSINTQDKAQVDRTRCILCGYCAAVCPHFCIKVY